MLAMQLNIFMLMLCIIGLTLADEEVKKEGEAQDRFVDLSVDVSYGLPQLGYVYNGLHLRSPRRGRARQSSAKNVKHTDPQPEIQGGFKPTFDFESSYNDVKEEEVVAGNSDQKVLVEEEAAPVDQYQNYVTKPPSSVATGSYIEEPNEANYHITYEEPTYESPANYDETPLNAGYSEPVSTYNNAAGCDQYSQPPYAAPHEGQYAQDAYSYQQYSTQSTTKPPLHIKIQQDFQGLVGSMTNMFKSQSKQGTSSFGFLPQAEGKPPLMEKIKQDFFSWLPSSKSKSSNGYTAPITSYTQPEAEYAQPEYVQPEATYAEPDYNQLGQPSAKAPPRQFTPRRPLLNKFISDFHKANTWFAKQTLDLVSGQVQAGAAKKIRRRNSGPSHTSH